MPATFHLNLLKDFQVLCLLLHRFSKAWKGDFQNYRVVASATSYLLPCGQPSIIIIIKKTTLSHCRLSLHSTSSMVSWRPIHQLTSRSKFLVPFLSYFIPFLFLFYLNLFHLTYTPVTSTDVLSGNLYFYIKKLSAYGEEETFEHSRQLHKHCKLVFWVILLSVFKLRHLSPLLPASEH